MHDVVHVQYFADLQVKQSLHAIGMFEREVDIDEERFIVSLSSNIRLLSFLYMCRSTASTCGA